MATQPVALASPQVVWGYRRKSSLAQSYERQTKALADAGVAEERIFEDAMSGKNMNRPGWLALVSHVREGMRWSWMASTGSGDPRSPLCRRSRIWRWRGLDEAGMSARAIAEYLGHAAPSVTQDVYMARNVGSQRAAAALDRMFGVSPD